jgi:multisubunit Na+/H+ antiporter MnhB subunit
MIFKYILAWPAMVVIGIINGVIREFGYKRYVGELIAHQISTLTAVMLFGVFTYALSFKWRIESAAQAFKIGLIWLTLTVLFEFLFGHYVMKNSWQKLLHDYNILEGRFWLLVLLWIFLAPFVIYEIRS